MEICIGILVLEKQKVKYRVLKTAFYEKNYILAHIYLIIYGTIQLFLFIILYKPNE